MNNTKKLIVEDIFENLNSEGKEAVIYLSKDNIKLTYRAVGSRGGDKFENQVLGTIQLSSYYWGDIIYDWTENPDLVETEYELKDVKDEFINENIRPMVEEIING